MGSIELQVGQLFEKPKTSKRKWSMTNAKEQADKWSKLQIRHPGSEEIAEQEQEHQNRARDIREEPDLDGPESDPNMHSAEPKREPKEMADCKQAGEMESRIATVHGGKGLVVEDARPPFDDVTKWLDWDTGQEADPSFDMAAAEVDQQSLLEAPEAVVRKEQVREEHKILLDRSKESIKSACAWEMHEAPKNILFMIKIL